MYCNTDVVIMKPVTGRARICSASLKTTRTLIHKEKGVCQHSHFSDSVPVHIIHAICCNILLYAIYWYVEVYGIVFHYVVLQYCYILRYCDSSMVRHAITFEYSESGTTSAWYKATCTYTTVQQGDSYLMPPVVHHGIKANINSLGNCYRWFMARCLKSL